MPKCFACAVEVGGGGVVTEDGRMLCPPCAELEEGQGSPLEPASPCLEESDPDWNDMDEDGIQEVDSPVEGGRGNGKTHNRRTHHRGWPHPRPPAGPQNAAKPGSKTHWDMGHTWVLASSVMAFIVALLRGLEAQPEDRAKIFIATFFLAALVWGIIIGILMLIYKKLTE